MASLAQSVGSALRVPAVFMRGGTSRALFFREEDLASYDTATRDRIILAAMGSPDPDGRQIDGLGGGISSLSKVAVIGKSEEPDVDVTFTFGQVEVREPRIDWGGTCGNISAAVGPYAIDEELVTPTEPETRVTVLATNTGKRFIAHVPVRDGRADPDGDFAIAGVPGAGARITLEFLDPGSSLGRGVLPTGDACQAIRTSTGLEVRASLVDAAIPAVFVGAEDLGADAAASAADLDEDRPMQRTLEEARCMGAVAMGMAGSAAEAERSCRAAPKIAIVDAPVAYTTSGGVKVRPGEIDLVARAVSMGNTHRTFPGTVSMGLAAAAAIDGTVVRDASGGPAADWLRIGHPAGVMDVAASVSRRGDGWHVESITTQRTARRIMEGHVCVPRRNLAAK